MKHKARTRVATLCFFFALICAGVSGTWLWYGRHRDPARFVRLAEALMAQGRVDDAVAQYRRALRAARDPSERSALMMRAAGSLSKLPPQPVATAARRFGTVLRLWEQAARADAGNLEAVRTYTGALYKIALGADTPVHWRKLLAVCQAGLLRGDDPVLRKYRGIARFRSTPWTETDGSVRQSIRVDLQRAISMNPADPEPLVSLGRVLLAESAELRAGGFAKRAGELCARAVALLDEYIESRPGDVAGHAGLAGVLFAAARLHGDDELLTRASEVLGRLVELLGDDGPRRETLIAAGLLATHSLERHDVPGDAAVRLLRGLAERCPGEPDVLTTLARMLQWGGEQTEAAELLERVRRGHPQSVSAEAVTALRFQLVATFGLASLRLEQCRSADSVALRESLLAQAEELRQELASGSSASGLAQLLGGRIAFITGKLRPAVSALRTADAEMAGRSPEAVRLAGLALARLGETGAAVEHLERYLSMADAVGPQRRQALRQLASLYLRLGRFDDVLAVGKGLTDGTGRDLSGRLLVVEAKLGQAIRDPGLLLRADRVSGLVDELSGLAEAGLGVGLQRLADLYVLTGRRDDALRILEGRLSTKPDDAETIVQLLRVEAASSDPGRYRERLLSVAAQAVDSEVASLLRRAAEDPHVSGVAVGRLVRLAFEQDPVTRSLGLYRHYSEAGRDDDAVRILREAPPEVTGRLAWLRVRFDKAVETGDWDRAASLVETEAAPQLDAPDDALWRARLLLARGSYAAATASLTSLTEAWPLVSEGWLLLGEGQRLSGELAAAEKSLRKALALKPDHAGALDRMARVHDARGEYFEALECLSQAAAYAPGDRRVVDRLLSYMAQHGSATRALAIRGRLADLHPSDRANRRAVAELLASRGQTGPALELLESLVAEYPGDGMSALALARFHERHGRASAGRSVLEAYLAGAPGGGSGEDQLRYAEYLIRNGLEDGVAEALRLAASSEGPARIPAVKQLARWHMGRGDVEAGLRLYRDLDDAARDSSSGRAVVEALLRLKRLDEARAELDRLSHADAGRPDGHLSVLRARVALGLGDLPAALAACTQACELLPGQANVYLLRAHVRWDEPGDDAQGQVRRDLEKALELDRDLRPARELLARWFADRGQSGRAVELYDQLVRQFPDQSAYRSQVCDVLLRSGDSSALDVRLRSWREQDGGSARLAAIEAKLHLRRGEWEQAAARLKRLNRESSTPDLLLDLVGLQLSMGKPEDALSSLAENEVLTNGSALLLAKKARALAALGRKAEGAGALREAVLAAREDNAKLQAVLDQAPPGLSAEALSELVGAARGAVSELVSVFAAREKLGAGDIEAATEALEGIRSGLRDGSPVRGRVLLYLANAYFRTGRHAEAEKAYGEAFRSLPDDAVLLNNLGHELSVDLGDPLKAIELARRALTLAEGNVVLQAHVEDTLGWAQFAAGLRTQARRTLEQSVAHTELPANRLHLGRIRLAARDPEGARGDFLRARELAAARGDQATRSEAERLLAEMGD